MRTIWKILIRHGKYIELPHKHVFTYLRQCFSFYRIYKQKKKVNGDVFFNLLLVWGGRVGHNIFLFSKLNAYKNNTNQYLTINLNTLWMVRKNRFPLPSVMFWTPENNNGKKNDFELTRDSRTSITIIIPY